jgi:hypothetical protein
MMKRMIPKQCVYCTKSPGITKDHVPPRIFFPEPRPGNLITVPACSKCNSAATMDDNYLFAIMMFSEAGNTIAGVTLWRKRLRRMFTKDLGVRRQLGSALSLKDVITSGGIYQGRRIALAFDELRFNKAIQRIVRGLCYFEFGSSLSAETSIASWLLSTPARSETAMQYYHQISWGKRRWPGIFEYRCSRVDEGFEQSMWFIRFYNNIYFWAITGSDETPPCHGIPT